MKEEDIRLEFARALYAGRKFARGIAAELACLEADVFERELQQRGISNGCQPRDLVDELKALNPLLSP